MASRHASSGSNLSVRQLTAAALSRHPR